jgi:hypothetical protein
MWESIPNVFVILLTNGTNERNEFILLSWIIMMQYAIILVHKVWRFIVVFIQFERKLFCRSWRYVLDRWTDFQIGFVLIFCYSNVAAPRKPIYGFFVTNYTTYILICNGMLLAASFQYNGHVFQLIWNCCEVPIIILAFMAFTKLVNIVGTFAHSMNANWFRLVTVLFLRNLNDVLCKMEHITLPTISTYITFKTKKIATSAFLECHINSIKTTKRKLKISYYK